MKRGNGSDVLSFLAADCRIPDFKLVDANFCKQLSDSVFFASSKYNSRSLFAISQGCVDNPGPYAIARRRILFKYHETSIYCLTSGGMIAFRLPYEYLGMKYI